MSRAFALIAVVALVGLTGCTVPWLTGATGPNGHHGPTGRTGPTGPSMSGGPRPSGPSGATVLTGGGALTDNVNDSYVAWGEFSVSSTEPTVAIPLPVGGTLSDLKVFVDTAPGTGASWTLTVDKNESATALSCAIEGVATSCSDASLVAVVVADKLDLDVTPVGAPVLATITWSVTITP